MSENKNNLKRRLTNRHIQLIALGGAIGTGLFLGLGEAVVLAGPSVMLGYAIAGFIAFLIMRQLGEMVVEEPVSGSFSHFANKYWSHFAGFASGWNYWLLYILVSMSELAAIGIYVQFWWPEIALWQSSLFFFVIINLINLTNVRIYGEVEFWFSIVKIVAIVALILFGVYLLFSGAAGSDAGIDNIWKNGGFMPHGFLSHNANGEYHGLLSAMAFIMFSFGGLELIGIAAAETDNPEKIIPKATNQVIYRILFFYVGSLLILFSLTPWGEITAKTSPFVAVFHNLNSIKFHINGEVYYLSRFIANAFNIVVLMAALSVYNSSLYSNSRMLYALALQKNAPSFLAKLRKNQVPLNAILLSALVTFACVVINFVMPENALKYLISLVVSSLIINWVMITITHLYFKRSMIRDAKTTKFPAFLYPFGNYITIFFLCLMIPIMWVTGMQKSILLIPVWIGLLYFAYFFFYRKRD